MSDRPTQEPLPLDAWASEPEPAERCICGRPALFVLTNRLGSTPWCGSGREVVDLLPVS